MMGVGGGVEVGGGGGRWGGGRWGVGVGGGVLRIRESL